MVCRSRSLHALVLPCSGGCPAGGSTAGSCRVLALMLMPAPCAARRLLGLAAVTWAQSAAPAGVGAAGAGGGGGELLQPRAAAVSWQPRRCSCRRPGQVRASCSTPASVGRLQRDMLSRVSPARHSSVASLMAKSATPSEARAPQGEALPASASAPLLPPTAAWTPASLIPASRGRRCCCPCLWKPDRGGRAPGGCCSGARQPLTSRAVSAVRQLRADRPGEAENVAESGRTLLRHDVLRCIATRQWCCTAVLCSVKVSATTERAHTCITDGRAGQAQACQCWAAAGQLQQLGFPNPACAATAGKLQPGDAAAPRQQDDCPGGRVRGAVRASCGKRSSCRQGSSYSCPRDATCRRLVRCCHTGCQSLSLLRPRRQEVRPALLLQLDVLVAQG